MFSDDFCILQMPGCNNLVYSYISQYAKMRNIEHYYHYRYHCSIIDNVKTIKGLGSRL